MPPTRDADGRIPVDQWIVHPPVDSADYLEGEPPTYADDGDEGGSTDGEAGASPVVDQEATDG